MAYRQSASLRTLQLRAVLLRRIREFFAARGVLEVETPALSPSAPTDPALESIAATARSLGSTHYLQTSPEFAMKRLLAAGSGDIYQICRVFRDDELGRWHQPEFTMVEWYRLGWDDVQLMDEVQDLVCHLLNEARGWPAKRMTYENAFLSTMSVSPRSEAATLAARLQAQGIDVPKGLEHDELVDLSFSTVVVPSFEREALTFIYDYPADQSALARIKPGTPPVAARFELFAAGLELANGFAELTDSSEQRRRFDADQANRLRFGLPVSPIDEHFLAALDQGLPECAGVALGFDRLVAVAANLPSVAEAVAFAHCPRES